MNESKGTSGAPQNPSGIKAETEVVATQSSQTEQERKDAVAYETYRKVLSEKKKLEEKYESMIAENSTLKDEKLSAEGKTLELLDSTRKKLVDTEGRFKKAVGTFSYRLVSNAIQIEAAKLGCTNATDLISLSDLSSIEVDDDFGVNADQVRELVDKQRRERPYLFVKNASSAKVGAGVHTPDTHVDFTKLPLTEQAKLIFMTKK